MNSYLATECLDRHLRFCLFVFVLISCSFFALPDDGYAGLELGVDLPVASIVVDGIPNDWSGIPAYLEDEEGDSTQGVGTDIKAVYLCKDDTYLYWRMDTWSGTFSYIDVNDGPSLFFQSGGDAFLDVRMYFALDPPKGGMVDEVAEGKILLSEFNSATFNRVLGYYGSSDHYDRIEPDSDLDPSDPSGDDDIPDGLSSEYFVYGSNSFEPSESFWETIALNNYNLEALGYDFLGNGYSTKTFSGSYWIYIITAKKGTLPSVDCVTDSNGNLLKPGATSNVDTWANAYDGPDNVCAYIGDMHDGQWGGLMTFSPYDGEYPDSITVHTCQGSSPDDPLSVSIEASPLSGNAPLKVDFSVTISGGNSPYTFEWDFADGSTKSNEQNPSHTYHIAGNYTAQVSVTDADGENVSESTQIAVEASIDPSSSVMPDSGQEKCYDADGNELNPCPLPGSDFYGQDGCYSINQPSYTKLDGNGNQLEESASSWSTVRDNVTGLIWHKGNTQSYTWYDPSDPYDVGTSENGTDTQDYIDLLNSVHVGGFSDWRLPNVWELASIVDYGRDMPVVDPVYFPQIVYGSYWTAVTAASLSYSLDATSSAWTINFMDGTNSQTGKNGTTQAMAVRGTPLTSIFVDNNDSTITDATMGLMWQKVPAGSTTNWEVALETCENLELAGYSDWRLPTVKELTSLVDYTQDNPAINTDFFPDTPTSKFWTSTTLHSDPDKVYTVDFQTGFIGAFYEKNSDYPNYIRAVRSIESDSGTPQELSVSVSTPEDTGVFPFAASFICQITGGTPPYDISWDFGDGSSVSSLQNPSHIFENHGIYITTCTVTDAEGQMTFDSINIEVNPSDEVNSSEQVLLDSTSFAGSYYGMYSEYASGASFTLTKDIYVSTIVVVLRTASDAEITDFHFSLQNSLDNPTSIYAEAVFTLPTGASASEQSIDVNQTLNAGTYYLLGQIPGYTDTIITPGNVNGWYKSDGNYVNTAGTIADGLWGYFGVDWHFSTDGIYHAPAFRVNGVVNNVNVPVVLSDASPDTAIASGTTVKVYGTSGINSVALESGAHAELINFQGSNIITIAAETTLFTISRSGAVVTLEGTDGTTLKMPATTTPQTISFTDTDYQLRINDGMVMLGDQVIDQNSESIDPPASNEDSITNSLDMTFNLIPADTFMMGSPEDELGRFDWEGSQHQVTFTQSFYM